MGVATAFAFGRSGIRLGCGWQFADEARLPKIEIHKDNGVNIGLDRWLFILLPSTIRLFAFKFGRLCGRGIQTMRYRIGSEDIPLAGTAETIATFDSFGGIGSTEGIGIKCSRWGNCTLVSFWTINRVAGSARILCALV